jgi:hypothetical protein
MPGGDASPSAPFVICHRDGSSDRQDLPDKQPLAQSLCIFCTLAKAPCAILPIDHGIVISPAMGISNAALQSDGRTIAFIRPRASISVAPRRNMSATMHLIYSLSSPTDLLGKFIMT